MEQTKLACVFALFRVKKVFIIFVFKVITVFGLALEIPNSGPHEVTDTVLSIVDVFM